VVMARPGTNEGDGRASEKERARARIKKGTNHTQILIAPKIVSSPGYESLSTASYPVSRTSVLCGCPVSALRAVSVYANLQSSAARLLHVAMSVAPPCMEVTCYAAGVAATQIALKLVIVVVGRCHEEPEAKSICPRAVELDRIYLLFSSPTPLSVWASDLHGIGTAAAKGEGKDSEIAH